MISEFCSGLILCEHVLLAVNQTKLCVSFCIIQQYQLMCLYALLGLPNVAVNCITFNVIYDIVKPMCAYVCVKEIVK